MRSYRNPFDGFRRLFGRRPPLLPPRRDYGGLGGLGGPGRLGSPFGYGRERTVRFLLIGIALLVIGIYLGRNWNELF